MNFKLETCSDSKTYATADNAEKAILKFNPDFNYMIVKLESHNHSGKHIGRYVVVCIGEKALQRGMHFHFHSVN